MMTGTEWNDNPQAGGGRHELRPAGPGQDPPADAAEPSGPAGPSGADTAELSMPGAAPRPRRTRLVVAAVAAVAVLAVAGIVAAISTGSPRAASHRSPAEVLAAAARKSAAVSSVTATFTEQIGGTGGGTVSATVQEVRRPLQMSMTMTESMGGQTIPLSAILSGNAMYFKFGALAGLPRAIVGKWLEIPLTGIAGGSFATLLQSVENENPLSQTQLLLAAHQLRADGTQVIGGVNTTKYTGNYAPAAALKMLPASERAALAPAMKAVSGKAYFTIWIDASDQIRKLVLTETVKSEPVTVSVTYQSVNTPVTITIPPANQVLHIPVSALNGSA